jgi:feruloyl-CoA synthase
MAGSSERVVRAMLLANPPDVDAGEITDKGYLNQLTTVRRRDVDIVRLYAATGDGGNLVLIV